MAAGVSSRYREIVQKSSEGELRTAFEQMPPEQRAKLLEALRSIDTGDSLIMWNRKSCSRGASTPIKWTHTLAPSPRVSQLVVGQYSAFFLLEDGTCWRVMQDLYEALPEPQKLDALCNACQAPIKRLGLDGETVFAITDKEVWMENSPEEGLYWSPLAAQALCQKSDLPEPASVDENGEPYYWFTGPHRCGQICGRGVTDIAGTDEWGIVSTDSGKAFLYLSTEDAGKQWGRGLGESFVNDLKLLGGSTVFAEVDVGAQGAQKAALSVRGHMDSACFLMQDGCVSLFSPNSDSPRFKDGIVSGLQATTLRDIVDVFADNQPFIPSFLALDIRGNLWRHQGFEYNSRDFKTAAKRVAVAGGSKVEQLCGSVVAINGEQGEDAYALSEGFGTAVAAVWATGFEKIRSVQVGCHFGIAHFSGTVPSTGLGDGVANANSSAKGGANLMAYQCGHYEALLPETGCDDSRLGALLAAGCSASTAMLDGYGKNKFLLGEYAVRAAPRGGGVGETGMAAAVHLMMKSGVTKEAQAASVAWAVESGADGALALLASAGCVVTDEDRARCSAYEEPCDEF